jgi:hypothetical protein
MDTAMSSIRRMAAFTETVKHLHDRLVKANHTLKEKQKATKEATHLYDRAYAAMEKSTTESRPKAAQTTATNAKPCQLDPVAVRRTREVEGWCREAHSAETWAMEHRDAIHCEGQLVEAHTRALADLMRAGMNSAGRAQAAGREAERLAHIALAAARAHAVAVRLTAQIATCATQIGSISAAQWHKQVAKVEKLRVLYDDAKEELHNVESESPRGP